MIFRKRFFFLQILQNLKHLGKFLFVEISVQKVGKMSQSARISCKILYCSGCKKCTIALCMCPHLCLCLCVLHVCVSVCVGVCMGVFVRVCVCFKKCDIIFIWFISISLEQKDCPTC